MLPSIHPRCTHSGAACLTQNAALTDLCALPFLTLRCHHFTVLLQTFELLFECAARQAITQEVPLVNTSDTYMAVTATISGAKLQTVLGAVCSAIVTAYCRVTPAAVSHTGPSRASSVFKLTAAAAHTACCLSQLTSEGPNLALANWTHTCHTNTHAHTQAPRASVARGR